MKKQRPFTRKQRAALRKKQNLLRREERRARREEELAFYSSLSIFQGCAGWRTEALADGLPPVVVRSPDESFSTERVAQ
ncbi:MAG: hypothetical protein QXG97_06860 [Nitrososphaerota archaeon]